MGKGKRINNPKMVENRQRMKAGEHLVKNSGKTVPPKNVSKRKGNSKGK